MKLSDRLAAVTPTRRRGRRVNRATSLAGGRSRRRRHRHRSGTGRPARRGDGLRLGDHRAEHQARHHAARREFARAGGRRRRVGGGAARRADAGRRGPSVRTQPLRRPTRRASSARCTSRCSTRSARRSTTRSWTSVSSRSRVRQTLSQVVESEQALISTADRARITSEVSDEILGHGPLEPFLRDRDVTEIMVNGADQIYVERAGRIHRRQRRVHRRQPPAPHDREDRRPDRPPYRRVQPDGRRPPARRQPRQRGAAAGRARRPDAHHPQVRRGPARRWTTSSASAR